MTNDSARGWLLVLIQVVIFLVYAFLPTRSTTLIPSVAGGILLAVGGVVVAMAFLSLGNALTANPVPLAHAHLRTSGIFSVVRHPIYTGILIGLAGYVILRGTWWTLAWWVITVLFFRAKSRWEDSLLAAKHGAEWTAWAHNTPALMPFSPFRRKSAP